MPDCANLMCYLLCVLNAVAIGLSFSLSENRNYFFVLIVVVEQKAVQHVVTGATQPKMETNAAFGVRIETAARSILVMFNKKIGRVLCTKANRRRAIHLSVTILTEYGEE